MLNLLVLTKYYQLQHLFFEVSTGLIFSKKSNLNQIALKFLR